MNKKMLIMVLTVGLACVTAWGYAEGDKNKDMTADKESMGVMGGGKMGQEGMMGKGGMMGGEMMGHMHAMMMKGAMGASLVATSDGGVVVLKGNILTKYDKNLNVIQTVSIEDGGMAGMGGRGGKKKPCCMGMKKMMMDDDEEGEESEGAAPAVTDDGHESHHPAGK